MTQVNVDVTIKAASDLLASAGGANGNAGTAGAIAGDALGQMLDKNAAAGLVAKTIVDNLFSASPEVLQGLLGLLNGLKNAGATSGPAPGTSTKADATPQDVLLNIARTPFGSQELENQVFNQISSKLGSMASVPPALEKSIKDAVSALNKGPDNGGIDKSQFDTIINKAFASAKATSESSGDPIIKGLTDLLSKKDLSLADISKAATALSVFGVGSGVAAPGTNGTGTPGSVAPGTTVTPGTGTGTVAPGTGVGTTTPAPAASQYPPGVSRFVAADGNTYVVVTGSLAKDPMAITALNTPVRLGEALASGRTPEGNLAVNFGASPDEAAITRMMQSLRSTAMSLSSTTKQSSEYLVSANSWIPTSASIAAQILQEQQRRTA